MVPTRPKQFQEHELVNKLHAIIKGCSYIIGFGRIIVNLEKHGKMPLPEHHIIFHNLPKTKLARIRNALRPHEARLELRLVHYPGTKNHYFFCRAGEEHEGHEVMARLKAMLMQVIRKEENKSRFTNAIKPPKKEKLH